MVAARDRLDLVGVEGCAGSSNRMTGDYENFSGH